MVPSSTNRRRHSTFTDESGDPIICTYLPEPFLVFGDDGLHVDPKAGIARYGPRSYTPHRHHPAQVRVGIVGTAETVQTAQAWLESNAEGVLGDEKNPEFPGFKMDRGFYSNLEFSSGWTEILTQQEMREFLKDGSANRERFDLAVGVIEDRVRLLSERDAHPDYIVLALPNAFVKRLRTIEYFDPELGMVHRDFRRAVKASAMKFRIPTQILRQTVMEGRDPTPASKIAWNFFTGLCFKAGGTPWGPHGLEAGSCYVGISFYRPLGTKFRTMHTSLVQAFDEHGEGLVLRGPDFEWDPDAEESRTPHLSAEKAAEVIELVLGRYKREMHQDPKRVIVHKTSRFLPAEREGIEAVLRERVSRYDLLALAPQSSMRLITTSKYPPLRGTRFSVGDLDFLYTTGFISALNEFHGMHVPSPLEIADHVGQDTSREVLLREVLTLTKMNWNAAHLGGLLPITIRFARLVGDIMREIPPDREPLPQYKFYM